MHFGFLLVVVFCFVVYSADVNPRELTKKQTTFLPPALSNIVFDYSTPYDILKIMIGESLLLNDYYQTFAKEINSNEIKNKKLWKEVVQENDIKTLKQMKLLGIEMKLSTNELIDIIFSLKSVDYY